MRNLNLKICGLLFVLLVYCLQLWLYSSKQPRISSGNGRGDDGITYGAMAEQIIARQPISGPAPFVYRVGGPWLAAQYVNCAQIIVPRAISVDNAYQQIDIVLMALLLSVIYLFALEFCSFPYAAIATCLYSLPWWSYTRCIWFCPITGDIPWMVGMVLGLRQVIAWKADFPHLRSVVLFSVLCFSVSFTRETGILLWVVYLFSRTWIRRHASVEVILGDRTNIGCAKVPYLRYEIFLTFLFGALSYAGLLLPRFLSRNTGEFLIGGRRYTFVGAISESIRLNTLWHLIASLCLAFGGPLMGLFVLYHRYLRVRLSYSPALTIYCISVIALSYIGGVNTIRFLSWASPVVLILIGHLSEKLWNEEALSWRLRYVTRSLVLCSLAYYIFMVHPFSGYFSDYSSWVQWGGLQFSSIKSLRYILPSILLAGIFILFARKLVEDAYGRRESLGT